MAFRMNPIIIVTPSGRTGTTLLMSLLAQHDAIVAETSYPYELRILQACTPNEYISPVNLFDYPFQSDRDEKLAQIEASLANNAPLDYYSWLAARQHKTALYAVEKLVGTSVDAIRSTYRGARIIISMRDPRDTLLSARRFDAIRGVHGFIERPGDSDLDVVRRTRQNLDALAELADADDCHVVRYERLIQTPQTELFALSSWLGIAPFRDFTAPSHPHHQTSTDGAASIGRWHQEMSSALADICAVEWSSALERFGYNS